MKICIIRQIITSHTPRFVKWFADRGHEVHLISHTLLPPDGPKVLEYAQFHESNIDKRYPPIIKILPFKSKWAYAFLYRKLIKEIDPDVVHGQDVLSAGWQMVFSGGYPKIVTAMGSEVLITPKNSMINKLMLKYTVKRVDLIHSVSEQITKELISYGADKEKIITFPRGIDVGRFKPNIDGTKIKKELSFENNHIVISNRHFEQVYKIELLLEAIPYVIQKDDNFRFIIMGRGTQEKYLRKLTEKLNIEDYVKFIPYLSHDKLPKYLAAADIYVSTSLSDGAPNSTFEAMACGAFPVVTDIPANRPWISNGKNGFLVPFDPKILAEKILDAFQNEELRMDAKEVNWNIVKEKCNSYTNLERMERVYYELVKNYRDK